MTPQATLLDALTPPDGQRLRAAVLTTFDLDIHYLETVVLPTILGIETNALDREGPEDRIASRRFLNMRSRLRESNVAVLADAKRYDFKSQKMFETYELFFVRTARKFHPKLFVLAFERDFRLIVASANLTESGFHRNLEAVWTGSTAKGDRFGKAAKSALDFIDSVRKKEWPSCRSLARTLIALRQKAPKDRGGPALLHSESSRCILDQLLSRLPQGRHVEELHVVSPFFDRGDRLGPMERFKGAKAHIYVREERFGSKAAYRLQASKTALSKIAAVFPIIDPRWIAGSGEDEDERPRPRMLHAKLLAFRAGNRGFALLGSPNFTSPALFGQNTEAAVVLAGSWREIRDILPPSSGTVDIRKITSVEPEEAESDSVWVPFLTLAEYEPFRRKLRLEFSPTKSKRSWVVEYGGKILVSGSKGSFPRSKIVSFVIGTEPSLLLGEGSNTALFPIVVVDKELLPSIPGMEDLDYRDILGYFAHGISNLASFMEKAKRSTGGEKSPEPADTVPYMERLSTLSRALEGIRRRLAAKLRCGSEARALFSGDLGIGRVVEGLKRDRQLDPSFRGFALLEIAAMLKSMRWSGERRAKREARWLAGKLQRAIMGATDGTDRLRKLYVKYGMRGWPST